jgi:uncharacterized membrane protein
MWIERSAHAIETLAVVLIIGGIVLATVGGLFRILVSRQPRLEEYTRDRRRLARSLLLGPAILVAMDLIRTVALQTTFIAVA